MMTETIEVNNPFSPETERTRVVATAATFAEYVAHPDAFLTIQGTPPEIAARLPGFADFVAQLGIDGDRLVQAIHEAGPAIGPATPGWQAAMSRHGDAAVVRAEMAEAGNDVVRAENEFMAASFWYFLARFPHILNAEGAAAYKKHIHAYLRAAHYFAHPVDIIAIPFEGGQLTGYLRLPNGNAPATGWPIVVIWGGIDVWKSDLEIHSQSNALLKRGIATLAIDMPGTGECSISVSTHAERALLAAIDMIRNHAAIDSAHIGCYGLSFGGHFAVKLALLRPDLMGAVNNAGPVHATFQPTWVATLPMGARIALARVCGLDPRGDPQVLVSRLAELSLIAQGLLPATTHAPLLSINGEQDELVSIADLDLIQHNGVQQDRLVFAHDRHVASRNWALHEPFVAQWFARRSYNV